MNPASAPVLADAFSPRAPSRDRQTPRAGGAWPVAILGVPFDHVTAAETVAAVDRMIASRRPHYIVTANVDFLVQAHRDVELRHILLEADLVLCDGTPLVWASRWLGNALPERVAGSDLAPALMQRAAEKGHRVFLLGGAPGVAAEATTKLQESYPGIAIVGHYAPPFSALLEMNHEEIVERVRAARPDILLVSFGCPKQEKWIAMHHRALGVPVSIGVGATIDFFAGRVKRAPDWMRRTGTEWIYRLLQEPRRLYKRYATDLVHFLPALARECLRLRPARPRAAPGEVAAAGFLAGGIDLGGELTRAQLERERRFWDFVQSRDSDALLDASRICRVDATGLAFLLRWQKRLREHHRQLVLVAPSDALRAAFDTLNLRDHFHVAADFPAAARQAERLSAQSPVQRDGTTRAISWCGEIVAANVEEVWRLTIAHVQAFATREATLVIIDISRLRFIDSSGAALMLRLKKWARSLPAEILFAQPQPNVRNVLRLTRLDQLLLESGQ